MSETEYDTSTVESSMKAFKVSHDVNGLCARFEAASREFFGVDPDTESGSGDDIAGYTSGLTKANLAAMTVIARDGSPEDAKILIADHTKEELKDELEIALRESGAAPEDATIEIRDSIGPFLPRILGVLSVGHEIDVSEAIERHYDAIRERWPDSYGLGVSDDE
ncbi:MAG: hypothetical protein ABEH81_00810 [Halopenitus sp.]